MYSRSFMVKMAQSPGVKKEAIVDKFKKHGPVNSSNLFEYYVHVLVMNKKYHQGDL